MSEYNFQPKSAFDTKDHLRPIVAIMVSEEQLESRIHSLTGLIGDAQDVRTFSTPEFPWIFSAVNEADPRPHEDYQDAIKTSYEVIASKLIVLPIPIYIARVRSSGVNVWMKDDFLFARFNAETEQPPTIFSFIPQSGKIAWSAIREDNKSKKQLCQEFDDDMILLSQSPISAFMALGTIELLMESVPSNVSWR